MNLVDQSNITAFHRVFLPFSDANQVPSTPTSVMLTENQTPEKIMNQASTLGSHFDLASRLFNYALLGGTAPIPGGPLIGLGLGYGFDHSLDTLQNQTSAKNQTNTVANALILGTATSLKNFWMLDWVERNPHSRVSRVIIGENILFNTPLRRKLLSDIRYWYKMRNHTGQSNGIIDQFSRFIHLLNRHLTDPTIQRQELGLKGVHRATEAFVDGLMQPLSQWPTLYKGLTPIAQVGKFSIEALRGLPISYRRYHWLSQPDQMSFLKKAWHALPALLADIILTSALFYGLHQLFSKHDDSTSMFVTTA